MGCPFVITNVFNHGAVEIKSPRTWKVFKVNRHWIKPFYEGFEVQNIELVDLEDPSYSSYDAIWEATQGEY